MATEDLVEYEDEDGDFISVWRDTEEDLVVLQYNFLSLSFEPDRFRGFVEALVQAMDQLESGQ